MGDLNRQQRRKMQRELEENTKMIERMTPKQAKLIEMLAQQRTEETIEQLGKMYDVCLRAMLVQQLEHKTLKEIEAIEDDFITMCKEHAKKEVDFTQGVGGEMAKQNTMKLKKQMEIKAKELIELNIGQKESIERLLQQFPKASKAMACNIYKGMKAINEAGDNLDEALNYVFDGKVTEHKESQEIADAVKKSVKEVFGAESQNIQHEDQQKIKEILAPAIAPTTGKLNTKEVKEDIERKAVEAMKLPKLDIEFKTEPKVVKRVSTPIPLIEEKESNLKITKKHLEIQGKYGVYEYIDGEVKPLAKALYNDVSSYKSLEEVQEHYQQHLALINGFYEELKEVFSLI